MNNRDLLEEVLEKELGILKAEEDPEKHNQRVKEVTALYELKLGEDRLDEEASSKAMQRGIESERLEVEKEKLETQRKIESDRLALERDKMDFERDKLEHELKSKKEDTKQGWIRFGADLGKVVLTIAGNAGMLFSIMKFEETGTISNKFLGFTFKPKL